MLRSILFLVFLQLSINVLAADTSYKINSFVSQKIAEEGTAEVIVYLAPAAQLNSFELTENREERIRSVYEELKKTAEQSQKEIIKKLKKRNIKHQAFFIENAIYLPEATQETLDWVTQEPVVETVRINAQSKLTLPPVKKNEVESQNFSQVPDHLKEINVDKVWNQLGVKGAGIVVAGQDTGYFWQHGAIKKQYRGYSSNKSVDHDYNWHDAIHRGGGKCGADALAPCDDGNHGTHTMGTIVGDDGKKNRIGVAPEAKWIGCRNMDRGVGKASTYLECFQFFLAPHPVGGNAWTEGDPAKAPHVINNSWGCPPNEGCTGGEFVDAIRALRAAGIMVVVSAGNEGSRCGSVKNPPGTYAGELISVGSYNHRSGRISYFSSRGPSSWSKGLAPDIVAPGSGIRSSVPSSRGDGYSSMSGTSMAGPHVAGVVALLWSAKPQLIGQIEKTMQILKTTAQPKTSRQSCGNFPGDKIPNAVFGYGLIDAFAAIQSVQ